MILKKKRKKERDWEVGREANGVVQGGTRKEDLRDLEMTERCQKILGRTMRNRRYWGKGLKETAKI